MCIRDSSWAVSNIGYCGLNSNRGHIFGTGPRVFGSITTTITFSRNERSIRTSGARSHDFVFRSTASDPWIFYWFYWIFIADPKCTHHRFSKSERTYKYTKSEFWNAVFIVSKHIRGRVWACVKSRKFTLGQWVQTEGLRPVKDDARYHQNLFLGGRWWQKKHNSPRSQEWKFLHSISAICHSKTSFRKRVQAAK